MKANSWLLAFYQGDSKSHVTLTDLVIIAYLLINCSLQIYNMHTHLQLFNQQHVCSAGLGPTKIQTNQGYRARDNSRSTFI